jgi:hypothetical protein
MSRNSNRTSSRAAAPAAAAPAAPAAAPAAAPQADTDSFDSLAAAPAADAPAAEAPAAEAPAQVDENHDGHDDRTGQFVDGNEGRPEPLSLRRLPRSLTRLPKPRLLPLLPPTATTADEDEQAEETGELVPVYALAKIDGQPSRRIFTPETAEKLAELRRLGAVRDLTEAEAAVYGSAN